MTKKNLSLICLVFAFLSCKKDNQTTPIEPKQVEVEAIKSARSGKWITGIANAQYKVEHQQNKLYYLAGYPEIADGMYTYKLYKVSAKVELPVGVAQLHVKTDFEGYTAPLKTTRGFQILYSTEGDKNYAEVFYYVMFVDTDMTRSMKKYFPAALSEIKPFRWAYYKLDNTDIVEPPF